MRNVLRVFYALIILTYPIFWVIGWVYYLLKDCWWDKATGMADDTVAKIKLIREKK
jgi:hypothetical protein